MSAIALVVARAANGVIGANGGIPWHIPEDLRRFRSLTIGKPCIMGHKTWDSLPRKPLPGRLNIVVTRDRAFSAVEAVAAYSFEDALARAKAEKADGIAVIGGAEIYRAALALAELVHLTEIHAEFRGDACFPALDSCNWREIAREEHVAPNGLGYAFVTLERVTAQRKEGR